MTNTDEKNFNATIDNTVLPAVLSKKIKMMETLRDCVIKIEQLHNDKSFDYVNIDELLSCMDNAVFYMNAEIKKVESLNGKWSLNGR